MERVCESPCLTCKRVDDPADCENKQCRLWSRWYLSRWRLIHGFYEKYGKEKPHELEK